MNAVRARRTLLLLALACAAAGVCVVVLGGLASAPRGTLRPRPLADDEAMVPSAGAADASALARTHELAARAVASSSRHDGGARRQPIDAEGAREPLTAEGAIVRGRLVLDGEPAVGARVELRGVSSAIDGSAGAFERALASRRSDELPIVASAVTDSSGTFELVLAPGVTGLMRFSAAHGEHRTVRTIEVEDASELNLLDVRLAAPGTIRGRLIDRAARLPRDSLEIVASLPHPLEPESERWSARARVHPETGEFVIERAPAEDVHVSVALDEWPEVLGRTVHVVSSGETRVDLRYTGRDLTRAIWVRYRSPDDPAVPIEPQAGPAREHVRLLLDEKDAARPMVYAGVLLFRDLEPGSYELVVDDRRYVSARVSGVQPGHGVSIPVSGTASIALRVLDARTSEPIRAYRASLASRPRTGGIAELEPLQRPDRPPPADGTYRGVVPSWDELVVAAPGKGMARAALDGLRAGETLAVQVVLARPVRIDGTVVDENGVGISAEVIVRDRLGADPLDAGTDSMPWGWTWAIGGDARDDMPIGARVRSDENGAFSVDDAPSGVWSLQVEAAERVCRPSIVDTSRGAASGIVLMASRFGHLAGKVVLPARAKPDDCLLVASLETTRRVSSEGSAAIDDVVATSLDFASVELIHLEPDGSFGPQRLAIGTYTLQLSISLGYSGNHSLGELTIEPGATLERTFDLSALQRPRNEPEAR